MNDDFTTNPPTSSHNIRVAPKETEEKFEEKMQEIKLKEKEKIVRDEAEQLGLGYINLVGFPIGPETLTVVPKETAQRLKAICFLKTGKEIRLGVVNSEILEIKDLVEEIARKNHAHVAIYIISEHSFEIAMKLYEHIPTIKKTITDIEITEKDIERYRSELSQVKDLAQKIHEVPLTEIFTMILAGGVRSKASDIHIEAEEKDVKVRYRIDGVLHTIANLPKESWSRIISRIKLVSGLKINIDKVPQDGRVTLALKDEKIDVRVSTVPTAYGESVAMRLLMSSATGLAFEELGLSGPALKIIEREIQRPNGMILTSGPTGSGKTTALYAFLNKINTPETKIFAMEDPIEYKLEGINQSQVDYSKKYDFASGLKHILRQDPDIIMVGEIRDLETAEIAIQAALTGHLVFSTIHANDASGVIPRFLAMGAKPFLLAPSLNVIMAQRLVRKVCKNCKEEDVLDEETIKKTKEILSQISPSSGLKFDPNKKLVFYKGKGCDECHDTGYRGRTGIFEVFKMSAEIEKIILSGQVSEYQMKEVAIKNGMVTMVQDGLLKALDGITSVEEVFRVAE
jgi:type IV pilus assembly protein PilB